MDFGTILLAMVVFSVLYQGAGLILENRAGRKWGTVKEAAPEGAKKSINIISGMGAKVGFNRILLKNKTLENSLDQLLLRAGYPYGWKTEDLLLVKELGVLFMALMLWRSESTSPVLWLIGLFLGFWVPDVYMKAKGTARQMEIQRLLPGFVDLAALALESGLDLMSAIERILDKMKPSALRDELATLLQENRLGTPRKEVFQNLAYRANLPDIQSLTSIIIQSEELGSSLAGVFRNYGDDMRNRRILRAEEVAGKMPVKLLFPMMVFFFPIVFVIIFGPLALSFMNGYK